MSTWVGVADWMVRVYVFAYVVVSVGVWLRM